MISEDLPNVDEKARRLLIHNDIKEIRNLKHLDKVELDFESPRFQQAMFNLGVSFEEC